MTLTLQQAKTMINYCSHPQQCCADIEI